MNKQTVCCGLASALCVAACADLGDEASMLGANDDVATASQAATVAFAITSIQPQSSPLPGTASGCSPTVVAYSAAPATISGLGTLNKYELQRRHAVDSIYTSWVTIEDKSNASGSSLDMADFFALNFEPYEYRVRAMYKSGTVVSVGKTTAAKSFAANCVAPRASSGTTHNIEVYLFTPSDTSPPTGQTKSYINQMMFSTSKTNSLYNYMKEVSGGYSVSSAGKKMLISGTVHNWQNLAKPKAQYAGGLSDMIAETKPLFMQLAAASPSTYYVFIYNTGAAGGWGGGRLASLGNANLLNAGQFVSLVGHEFGHCLSVEHEVAIYCPDKAYPALLKDIPTECNTSTYGGNQNIMSNGSSVEPNYFNGVQKRRLGFLSKNNSTWFDVRTLAVGSSKEFSLVESTGAQTSLAKQLLFLKFDDDASAYALQYRVAKGFDTNTWGYADGVSKSVPFTTGVYAYLVPGSNHALGSSFDVGLLYRNYSLHDTAITTDSATTYYDSHRQFEIAVTNMGGIATVKVTRR